MAKNSFTLFETLISIVLLSIVIVGFTKESYYDSFDKEFMLLNKIENSFEIEDYDSSFSTNNQHIKLIKNSLEEEIILVKEIKYKDERIELIKYEMQ